MLGSWCDAVTLAAVIMSDEAAPTEPNVPGRSSSAGLSCSFCGQHQKAVAKLIAGPSVYICNECVELCQQILEEESRKSAIVAPPPHVLVEMLDRTVIGHAQQKRMLAAAFGSHRNHGLGVRRGEPRTVLLVGPRGTGKSHLVETVAAAVGMPVVVTELMRLEGFVAAEDVLCELVERARSASTVRTGVLCIEHVDAALGDEPRYLDRCQRVLLDWIDGVKNMARFRLRSKPSDGLDTMRLLFVLTSNSDRALQAMSAAANADGQARPTYGNPLGITAAGLVRSGMLPELVDRLGILCSFERLSSSELAAILRAPEGPIATHTARLAAEGCTLSVSDDAVELLAALASRADDGGRAPWRVLEGLCTVARARAADSPADTLVVNAATVREHLALD